MQTNQTSIEKALQLTAGLNPRLDLSSQQLKNIARMANCDMNVALNLLRIAPKIRERQATDDSMGKDLADTNLFHRFGKIMYNKSSYL